jgi:hypothetical protein
MKKIKSMLLNIFVWGFWKHFHYGLKSVLGHKALSASIKEMEVIESKIRLDNNLIPAEGITWENSKMTNREIFARYMTLRYFNEAGELLAFFKAVDKKRILKEL